MNHSPGNIFVQGCRALAEGLDFPSPKLVALSVENPILRCLAPVEEMDAAWRLLTGWIESIPDPIDRLNQLRKDYYHMFLRPTTDLFLYLRFWHPNQSTAAFLAELQGSLNELGVRQSSDWFNGSDHVAVVFELMAHLEQSPRFVPLVTRYVQPWFPIFVNRIKEQAVNEFFLGIGHVAAEVKDAMETLI